MHRARETSSLLQEEKQRCSLMANRRVRGAVSATSFFAATKKGPEGPVFLLYRIAINSLSYVWSGKRDSNSRPRPWQGRALPTELFPRLGAGHSTGIEECVKPLIQKVLFIWSRWSLNAARRLANIEPSTTTSALPQPAGVHNPPPPRS